MKRPSTYEHLKALVTPIMLNRIIKQHPGIIINFDTISIDAAILAVKSNPTLYSILPIELKKNKDMILATIKK